MRQQAAEEEEDQRRDEVEIADHLVVGGDHPLPRDRAQLTSRRRASRSAVAVRCSVSHRVPPSGYLSFDGALAGRTPVRRWPLATSGLQVGVLYSSSLTTCTLNSIAEW